MKKLLEVMGMLITLIVLYAYVQIHQMVHIQYMQVFVYQLYLNKTISFFRGGDDDFILLFFSFKKILGLF